MGYWTEQVHYKAGSAYLGQGFRIERRAPDAGQSAQRQPGQRDADGCRSTGSHILSTPILKNVNLQRAILRHTIFPDANLEGCTGCLTDW